MTFELTIVIPTIGREADCRRAIDSVTAVRRAGGLAIDLIVVEQGDRPSYRVPDDFEGRWVFVRRRSLTAARNVGLELARAPYVFFLDDDARITTNVVALIQEGHRTGAAMVCGRMRSEDGALIRGGARRATVRGWSAWRYFAEPAAVWDVAALRAVDGFDERVGPPNRVGGEDGAQQLGRLARAGFGCGVFVPVDVATHPPFDDAPPAKAKLYGHGVTAPLVLQPNRWQAAYAISSGLRRGAGLVVAAARRDRPGVRHRAAWLRGFLAGFSIGFVERRRPRREPMGDATIVAP